VFNLNYSDVAIVAGKREKRIFNDFRFKKKNAAALTENWIKLH